MENAIKAVPHEELKQAVRYLYRWQHGQDSFTCQLFGLIQKADPPNKTKLHRCFPAEVRAYELWHASPDEEAFFKEWLPLKENDGGGAE